MVRLAAIAALVVFVSTVALAQPMNGCPNPNMTCPGVRSAAETVGFVDAGSIAVSGGQSIAGSLNATFVDAGYVVSGQFRGTLAADFNWMQPQGSFMCFNYPTCTGAIRAGNPIQITALAPDSNNGYDFGTDALRWRHSFFAGEMSTAVVDAGQAYVANNMTVAGRTRVTGGLTINNLADSATAPTVTACSGGTAASITWSNGNGAFVFDVGTACTSESTAVITLPAATNGWLCSCSSTTADRMLLQKVIPPADTTHVTMQNITISTGASTDFTDSADVGCICRGG